MAGDELSTNAASEKAAEVRRLAERGLHEQAVGNIAEADRLLAQAQELDPDAVADVLREHDAGRPRGSGCRESSAADHAWACRDVIAAPQRGTTGRRADCGRAGRQGDTNDEALTL